MINFTSELIIDIYPLINPLQEAHEAKMGMTNGSALEVARVPQFVKKIISWTQYTALTPPRCPIRAISTVTRHSLPHESIAPDRTRHHTRLTPHSPTAPALATALHRPPQHTTHSDLATAPTPNSPPALMLPHSASIANSPPVDSKPDS